MNLNDNAKYHLAKSFTELAIQNNLFSRQEDSEKTAKEIAKFFNTIIDAVGKETLNN